MMMMGRALCAISNGIDNVPTESNTAVLRPHAAHLRTRQTCRRQEAVDLLLGIHRRPVDSDGNPVPETIKEPLDLDLWTTRLSPLPQGDATIMSGGESEALATATVVGEGKDDHFGTGRARKRDQSRGSEGEGKSCTEDGGEGDGSKVVGRFSDRSSELSPDDSSSTESELRDGEEDILSVGLDGDFKGRPRGGGVAGVTGCPAAGASGAANGLDLRVGGNEARRVAEGRGEVGSGGIVGRVAGTALAELRMAGPYSALALTVSHGVIGGGAVYNGGRRRKVLPHGGIFSTL